MYIYSFTNEQEVLGTVRFHYRGYTISLSTTPVEDAPQELMIAKSGTNDWDHQDTWTDDAGCLAAIARAKAIIDELHAADEYAKRVQESKVTSTVEVAGPQIIIFPTDR